MHCVLSDVVDFQLYSLLLTQLLEVVVAVALASGEGLLAALELLLKTLERRRGVEHGAVAGGGDVVQAHIDANDAIGRDARARPASRPAR